MSNLDYLIQQNSKLEISKALGWEEIGMGKSDFVAKTQFLSYRVMKRLCVHRISFIKLEKYFRPRSCTNLCKTI